MSGRLLPRAAVATAALLWLAPAFGQAASPAEVFDRTVKIVEDEFYTADALPAFREAAAEARPAALEPGNLDAAIDRILASLGASHTARYTPDEVAYYELSETFRFALGDEVRRLYPPEGRPNYDGIGIVAAEIDGKVFVTDVYHAGPAAKAGVLVGDEVVSVDGAPFAAIDSFRGKAGRTATLAVRRAPGAAPVEIALAVENLRAAPTLVSSIADSVHVVERGNRRIGYVRLWTYTSDRVTEILYEELGQGRLNDIDGLILDLRSRWGGAPADAAETFLGGTAPMTMTDRKGETRQVNVRFDKPVVAIIDEGTRSGMEILAYSLKQHGVPLVGVTTAKAVLAGTGFLLPDDSLLVLAVADVHVDGKRIEGIGVAPDLVVPFDIRYANGADPQLDAALVEMDKRLGIAGESVN